jgi:hypothetical protein
MAVRFSASSEPFLRFYNPQTDTAFENGSDRSLPCKVQCKHCGTWVAHEEEHALRTYPTLFHFGSSGNQDANPSIPRCFEPTAHTFREAKALNYTLNAPIPHFYDDGLLTPRPRSVGDCLLYLAPPLDGRGHKGGAGRVGVLGGSVDYAGAPFYAGMAALRVGAELLYLLTAQEATGPIKSYSPELMVSSVYKTHLIEGEEGAKEVLAMVARVEAKLPMVHALVIGPGLGRSPNVLEAVALIINTAQKMSLPVVIDADGLWVINQRPDLVRGYPPNTH